MADCANTCLWRSFRVRWADLLLSRNANKIAELGGKLLAYSSQPFELAKQKLEVRKVSCITPCGVDAGRLNYPFPDLSNQISKRPASTDEGSQICADAVGQVVDSVFNALCAWKQRTLCFVQSAAHSPAVPNSSSVGVDARVEIFDHYAHPHRQRGDFIEKKPANDPRVLLPQFHCFPVLLLRNPLRLLRDTCSAIRCSVGQEGHDRSAYSRDRADPDCKPVSQIPHLVRQRTELNRHKPSL